jgi:hypothetical protein
MLRYDEVFVPVVVAAAVVEVSANFSPGAQNRVWHGESRHTLQQRVTTRLFAARVLEIFSLFDENNVRRGNARACSCFDYRGR